MTHAVFLNLTTGTAHAEPAVNAALAKVTIKARSQQALRFGFFRTGTVTYVTGTQIDDTFTAVAHGLSDGDGVIFLEITAGYGLTANTVRYYLINVTANTFKVSLTPGGTAVNFTTNVLSGTFVLSTLAETATGWVSGKVVVKHLPESDVLLLATEVVASGSGSTARYTATWTAAECDGIALRAYLAGQTLPRACWAELEWIDGEGTHSLAFPIKLGPTFNHPDDGAPPAYGSPASEAWLSGRALRFDAAQALTSEQRTQALANLGITLDEDGRLTFHTNHWIDLNAPIP